MASGQLQLHKHNTAFRHTANISNYKPKTIVSMKVFRCDDCTEYTEVENFSVADLLMRLQLRQEVPYLATRMLRTLHCQLWLIDCHEAAHCQNRLSPANNKQFTYRSKFSHLHLRN